MSDGMFPRASVSYLCDRMRIVQQARVGHDLVAFYIYVLSRLTASPRVDLMDI